MEVISYLLLIPPYESSPTGIELTLFGHVTGSHQRLYPLYHLSLRTFVYEFLGILNLMSSATIFTSAHIAILLLSLHFFTGARIATLLLLLIFSGTPYYWFPYCINFYAWSAQEIFVALHMCWFFKFTNFPMAFLVYDLNLVPQRAVISLLSPYVVSHNWLFHFPTCYSLLVFLKSHLKEEEACFSFIFSSAASRDSVHTVFSHVLFNGGSYSGEISAKCRQAFEGCSDVIWTADLLYFLW